MSTRGRNAYELSLRQDDMDVFTAILQLSKCPEGATDYALTQFELCDCHGNGTSQVKVKDAALMEKLNKSPRVQKILVEMLGNTSGKEAPSLFQTGEEQLPATSAL